ncbi:MAG TPA: 50S ribosomal protein L21 [Chloroflexota bacterium]|nr:50S ribosomal protein L21 [Chloroflexota bacterium]
MYAVVETGGKQYRVEVGQTVDVERLPAEVGESVELGRVLMVSADDGVKIGSPVVSGARVVGDIVAHGRGKKIIVFRYKAKTRYRKKTGHRQSYTRVAIKDIALD